jgi:hypothetical protein
MLNFSVFLPLTPNGWTQGSELRASGLEREICCTVAHNKKVLSGDSEVN